MNPQSVLFETLLRLADDHLVLGHRVSQWCGHAPMLEEDLALPNIALDLLGQARALYTYAGEVEGKGRDEDALAYLRLEHEYHNLLLVELPNGDFGQTMLRQFYYSAFMEEYWRRCLDSKDSQIAAIAAKAIKEVRYHVRHSAEWVIRLGDGTDQSHERMRHAVGILTPYTGELFLDDAGSKAAAELGFTPLPSSLHDPWLKKIRPILDEAMLEFPADVPAQTGGRNGVHSEAMGFLLSELQYMQRTYPDMTW